MFILKPHSDYVGTAQRETLSGAMTCKGGWGALEGLSNKTFTGRTEGYPSVTFIILTKLSEPAELFRGHHAE